MVLIVQLAELLGSDLLSTSPFSQSLMCYMFGGGDVLIQNAFGESCDVKVE